MWNGPTSAQCRDRARCARQTTQGGGERTSRERERTHMQRARGDYQKGNRPELAECTDRVEWHPRGYAGMHSAKKTAWNGVPASEGKGHPDGTARRHTARDTRGGKGESGETQHQVPARAPRTGRERRAHRDGALHPPRQ